MALISRVVSKVIHYKRGDAIVGVDTCKCDECSIEFIQRSVDTEHRRSGKVADGKDLCKSCTKKISVSRLVAAGTNYLTNRTDEQKLIDAKIGGTASAKSDKINTGRFSKERWDSVSEEDRSAHGKRASDALHLKLQDPVYSAQHYAKIFAQTKIGYQSKGHKDLHFLIEKYGFASHIQIQSMQVDECNNDLKIVVEYNGDMWHCNPRTWGANQYNSAIRMTAGEKWQKDIARHRMLEKLGYVVVVVWESEWILNAQKYLDRIERICDEISEKRKHQEGTLLRFID